jgi:hypothetical protein
MRRRVSAFAALSAVVSLGALAGASPAGAAPPDFFGLVPQGAAPSSSDIERMGKGKVGSVRLLLNWTALEPVDDDYNFETTDEYIGDLAAAGIRPLPFVWGVPVFVSSNNLELPVGSAGDRAQWQEFLRVVAGRYGPGGEYWKGDYEAQHPGEQPLPVETYQIWNEQNAPKHVRKPDPGNYAELLELSDEAISAEDPGAEIVLGGMFGRPTGSAASGASAEASAKGGAIKAWSFIKRLYKTKGVKAHFDGVSLHPYSPDVAGITDQVQRVREVLKKKKDKKAELWVTEIGWGSGKPGRLGVGAKKQPKLLRKSFKLLLRRRGKWKIGGVFWYTWRDLAPGAAPCDWCATAGLFPKSGSNPKPAWNKFVGFTGGS